MDATELIATAADNRQVDRRTDIQADRQTDRQTDREGDREADEEQACKLLPSLGCEGTNLYSSW